MSEFKQVDRGLALAKFHAKVVNHAAMVVINHQIRAAAYREAKPVFLDLYADRRIAYERAQSSHLAHKLANLSI